MFLIEVLFNLVSVIPITLNFTFIFAKRVCRSSKLRQMHDIFIWRRFVPLNSFSEKSLEGVKQVNGREEKLEID